MSLKTSCVKVKQGCHHSVARQASDNESSLLSEQIIKELQGIVNASSKTGSDNQTQSDIIIKRLSGHFFVHLNGQCFDSLTHLLDKLGQLGVLLEKFHDLTGLPFGQYLALFCCLSKGFSMLGIGLGMSFVPVRLSCLGEQDKGGGISGLKTERKIQENKGIDVEFGVSGSIQANPEDNHGRLSDKKRGCAEKTGEFFSF